MIRIGITGQPGFVGTHLFNTIGLFKEEFEQVPFEDTFFQTDERLRNFVKGCDVIVHLAAMNRHADQQLLYKTNIGLVRQLIDAMEAEKVMPHVLFSSSTQEDIDSAYGRSKRDGRALFEEWAKRNGASFTGMVVPNVFGPFGRPNFNSFIVTFCYKLTHGEIPQVLQDNVVKLIYVGNLCNYILNKIRKVKDYSLVVVERDMVPDDVEMKVTDVLSLLETFKVLYIEQGIIPELRNKNEVNFFNTFRSYMDYDKHFPVRLVKSIDSRGIFVETAKLGMGGQVSVSTTVPGITRGNHFHTRKIERFTVIKGKARIQLRKVGTEEVLNFDLDGNEPAYVDMPIWYTHNITNTGDEDLYTQFWVNEWYNPEDSDTYIETI
nr:NAD-dependent epimerase/dehydratase family protein [uncultured Bacteroides sp.]